MEYFRQWYEDSPADAVLALDRGDLFGGIQVSKNWDFCFVPTADEDGNRVYKLYERTRLFNFTPSRLYEFLTNPRWAWFDSVRNDPRYIAAVSWAESLPEQKTVHR